MTKEEILEAIKSIATPKLIELALDVALDESATNEERACCVLCAVVMQLQWKEPTSAEELRRMGFALDGIAKLAGWSDETKFWRAIVNSLERKSAARATQDSDSRAASDGDGQTLH